MQSSQTPPLLKLGSRGSPLARFQVETVRAQLAKLHNISEDRIEITIIKTDGDRTQTENLSLKDIGGKGLFSKEIETALLAGDIDVGVHSAKDMATQLPAGLIMPAYLQREDVRDAFISLIAPDIESLPQGAKLGTSSLRRAAQMRRMRPDLQIVEFRGNVDTRLQKLADGVANATLLATAGLNRLGKSAHITQHLDPEIYPTAPAQGAIGLEIRENDTRTAELISKLNHFDTLIAITAERALLATLDGSCRTPIGARTTIDGQMLHIKAQILSPDGQQCFTQSLSKSLGTAPMSAAAELGRAIGQLLRREAGDEFLAALAETGSNNSQSSAN